MVISAFHSRTLAAALAAALAMTPPAMAQQAAQQVALSIEEARGVAVALAAEGRAGEALSVAQALLQRDATDAAAWIVVARVQRAAGDVAAAREAAREAQQYADTDDERYSAAMELAAVAFAQERRLAAQIWLRRAAEVAPREDLRTLAVQSLRQVRAVTPWQFSLGLSVVPSSNVNNGSRQETIEIAGLPFVLSGDARALSGLEITASVNGRYRFDGIGGQPAQLSFGLAAQRVRLSDEAREQAPDAEGADYAYEVLELGYGQVVRTWDGGFFRLDTAAGTNRYGGERLSTYGRLGASVQTPLGARALVGASASVERQKRFDRDDRSAWITRLDLQRLWEVGAGNVVTATAGVRRTASEAAEIDHRAALAGLSYRFAQPILGTVTLQAELDLERRIYDESPFSAGGRQDSRVRVAATFGLPGWNLYGFAPTATVEASRNISNVSLYDSEDLGMRLGIVSVF